MTVCVCRSVAPCEEEAATTRQRLADGPVWELCERHGAFFDRLVAGITGEPAEKVVALLEAARADKKLGESEQR